MLTRSRCSAHGMEGPHRSLRRDLGLIVAQGIKSEIIK
jgi:hypothetical protein